MAKPKLALIPAAQGTKFYSVLPSDGSGDFTFARGSVATRINAQGLIENVASGQSRLDYPMIDGVQKGCPHHILEPARTNLFTYSEDFSKSVWAKNSVGSASAPVVTLNYATSPDGTQNASRLQLELSGSSSSDKSFLENTQTLDGSSSYTLTFYIKSNNGVNQNLIFLQNSVSGNAITATNKWIRVEQSFSSNSTFNRGFGLMALGNIQQSVDVIIWGAQLEAGSYATSYIPTSGTAVTRSAETATGAGNSTTFNDSEGVLMAEIATENLTSDNLICISDGSNTNRSFIGLSNTTGYVYSMIFSGGSQSVNFTTTIAALNFTKIALKIKQNDFSLHINGFKIATNTSGTPSIGLNELELRNASGSSPFYGKTKQIQYFDSALADTQLEQLTSWQSFRDMANGQLYTIE